MIHIGDVYERTESGVLYRVTTIHDDYALADGVHNVDDQICIPLIGQTMIVADGTAYKRIECPHDTLPSKSTSRVATLYENVAFNNGVLDSELREIAWVLRDLAINAGAYSEEKIIAKCDEAVKSIHRSYGITRSTGVTRGSRGTVSAKALPPVK